MLITGILQVNLHVFQTYVIFYKATYNKIRMVQVISIYFGAATGYNFKRIWYFFSEDRFCLDEMLLYVAFHLGLLCLPKYQFRGFKSTKVNYVSPLQGRETYCFSPGVHLSSCLSVCHKSCPLYNLKTT